VHTHQGDDINFDSLIRIGNSEDLNLRNTIYESADQLDLPPLNIKRLKTDPDESVESDKNSLSRFVHKTVPRTKI
jgi:hypothetical protein